MRIRIENLSFTYAGYFPSRRAALQDVTLEIAPGEFVGLLGSSGSGKTTLLQLLAGLLRPTSGCVLLDGVDLWDKQTGPDLRRSLTRRIGVVFQFPEEQLFEERVYDDVAFGPRNLGWTASEVEEAVREALSAVELDFDEFRSRSPFALSEGEKRRVAIAGILAMNPEVLALDEPTAGLDPRGAEGVKRLLRRLHHQGKTILLVSHDVDLVAELAERVVALQEGRIGYDGPKRELFLQPHRLSELHLPTPRVVQYLQRLRAQGWDVRTDLFSLEQAKEEVASLVLRRHGVCQI